MAVVPKMTAAEAAAVRAKAAAAAASAKAAAEAAAKAASLYTTTAYTETPIVSYDVKTVTEDPAATKKKWGLIAALAAAGVAVVFFLRRKS